ncbi:MAG: hypothetical protein J1E80_07945 [Desulfovibrionaceae bacterium]|nr:hypothetical protein [Desulfovibrionaceae bacterium]
MSARYDWETIRAEYESGSTMGRIAKRHGVDKAAISRRARKENWTQDLSAVVARRAQEKVNGTVNTVDPKKRAEAVDRAADALKAVMLRHKEEWERHRVLMDEALAAGDFDRAKLAKITAETLKIRQEGERRAWGIVDRAAVDMTSSDGSMSPVTSIAVRFVEPAARAAAPAGKEA